MSLTIDQIVTHSLNWILYAILKVSQTADSVLVVQPGGSLLCLLSEQNERRILPNYKSQTEVTTDNDIPCQWFPFP